MEALSLIESLYISHAHALHLWIDIGVPEQVLVTYKIFVYFQENIA